MSAKLGSSFATLLLVLPLASIPLMAIFGIPEFTPATASDDPAESNILRRLSAAPAEEGPVSEQVENVYRDHAADLFMPQGEDSSNISLTHHSASQPLSSTRKNFWNKTAENSASTLVTAHHGRPTSVETREPSPRPAPTSARPASVDGSLAEHLVGETASGLTWRAAAQRLEEVGITKYRLERGHRADQFLFACLFSPGSDPRVVQRFEAESAEPLEAVEDVLRQVENWLQHRYVESRRWVR